MSKKINVSVQKHTGIDKKFEINVGGVWSAEVAYDDEDHDEVDAATELIAHIIELAWDEELFKRLKKQYVMKTWEKNESNIQSDYDYDLNQYLDDRGLL